MVAVYKYIKGYHVEEQLKLFSKSSNGEIKTNGWKNFKETGFQFSKQVKLSNCQSDPSLEWAAVTGSGLHISACRNA